MYQDAGARPGVFEVVVNEVGSVNNISVLSPRGIVYHARGNLGVRLVLASGERVLIGSQRSVELADAIAARSGVPVTGS